MRDHALLDVLDRMGNLLHDIGLDHAHIELQPAHQERNEVRV